MVIKDTFRNRILWYKFVRSEMVVGYLEDISWLQEHRFRIHDIVCDGPRGLFAALHPYPVQMCQFHQIMIVRHYLTSSPELLAARQLLDLTRRITQMDRETLLRNWTHGRTAGKTSCGRGHTTKGLAPIRIHG